MSKIRGGRRPSIRKSRTLTSVFRSKVLRCAFSKASTMAAVLGYGLPVDVNGICGLIWDMLTVGGISVGFYGADVSPVHGMSQWRSMTQGCGSHVASSRM